MDKLKAHSVERRPGGCWLVREANGLQRRIYYHQSSSQWTGSFGGVLRYGSHDSKAVAWTQTDTPEVIQGVWDILAEIPGRVTNLVGEVGLQVSAGTVLGMMEAMKMEFPLMTSQSGEVVRYWVERGQSVKVGQKLVTLRKRS